ncbi:MAG: DUF3488 and transglutaminase-like domain-containing protein [Lachnospiraceae bacterium]|nr:DUF3488 and transglutaminase-like domain-containing protein [Lachnospiraceae bacterium]
MRDFISREKFYRAVVCLLVVSVGGSILESLLFQGAFVKLFVWGVILPLVFTITFLLVRLRGRILLCIGSGLGVLAVQYWVGQEVLSTLFAQFGSWIWSGMPPLPEVTEDIIRETDLFATTSVFLFAFCAATLLCLLSLVLARVRGLRIGMCFLVIVLLCVCFIAKQPLSEPSAALSFLYLLFCGVEWIQEKTWAKRQSPGIGRSVVVWICPFLIVYLAFLLVLPTDHKPYEWRFVQNLWERLEDSRIWFSQTWGGKSREGFQMAFSGFDESPSVGGDLTMSHRTQMQVSRANANMNGLYLSGAIYNTFTGDGWEYTADEEAWVPLLDTMESVYAAERFAPGSVVDLFRPVTMEIQYEEMKSHYLFTPAKTRGIESISNFTYRFEKSGYAFQGYKGLGTQYKVQFYRLNNGNERFRTFLETQSTYQYDESITQEEEEALLSVKRLWSAALPFDFTETLLATHEANIKDHYLQTVSLSPQLNAYFESITQDAKSPLDQLYLIEKELESYTYTTTPGIIPEGEEFLDYFLLQTKKGYCTYFATAFVLLARTAGFPARYVQGYCVPIITSNGKVYEVSSAMAHAWPEVYVDGVGWVAFEPTPGYASMRYQSWTIADKTQSTDEKEQESIVHTPLPIQVKAQETEEEEPQKKPFRIPLDVLFLFVGGLLTAAVLIFAVDTLIRRLRYDRLNSRKKVDVWLIKTFKILEILGAPMNSGDTLSDLCVTIKKREELPQETVTFLRHFEAIRYGGGEVTEELLLAASDQMKRLLQILRRTNKWRYYWFLLMKEGG